MIQEDSNLISKFMNKLNTKDYIPSVPNAILLMQT